MCHCFFATSTQFSAASHHLLLYRIGYNRICFQHSTTHILRFLLVNLLVDPMASCALFPALFSAPTLTRAHKTPHSSRRSAPRSHTGRRWPVSPTLSADPTRQLIHWAKAIRHLEQSHQARWPSSTQPGPTSLINLSPADDTQDVHCGPKDAVPIPYQCLE